MDRYMPTNFRRTQETIYRRTGFDDARSNKTLPDRNGRIKIRDWSNPYPIGLKWRQTPSLIYLEDFFSCRTKLWNLRQRTPSNHPSVRGMVTLHPRISTHNDSIIRSQESYILSRSKEVEPTTSTMVPVPIRIRCEIGTYPRKQNDSIRRTITTTRPLPGKWQQQWRYHHATRWFIS